MSHLTKCTRNGLFSFDTFWKRSPRGSMALSTKPSQIRYSSDTVTVQLSTTIGTFLVIETENIPSSFSLQNGHPRVHGSWNATNTATGRLSSSDSNLQVRLWSNMTSCCLVTCLIWCPSISEHTEVSTSVGGAKHCEQHRRWTGFCCEGCVCGERGVISFPCFIHN